MTPHESLIEVTALTHTVQGRQLLRDVHLTLRRGELLAVLGRNGAGKSTLLRHLTGELGRRGVTVLGGPAHRPGTDLARHRAALPQHTPAPFAFSVLDIVLLGRIPHGPRDTPHDRDVARACLDRVGLRGAEGRDIQTLSGGEQQRVHLARTLAQLHGTPGDRVLLLDEPTASLDLAHQHATLRLARDLGAEGVGVLAVLHDLNLAAQYADRVLLLADGQVLTCAPPEAALTSGHIRAAYGHDVLVTRHPCLNCPLIVSAG
ncbi:heme ABC transporter ATP-binding protein [Deinococcus sp. JMULE3]|uniref:heme ABC transporter ATP-binding protein n=1 Tax=Deinococcus sp. JMULE3 TaxID=2518341 RepID=UPI00353017A9